MVIWFTNAWALLALIRLLFELGCAHLFDCLLAQQVDTSNMSCPRDAVQDAIQPETGLPGLNSIDKYFVLRREPAGLFQHFFTAAECSNLNRPNALGSLLVVGAARVGGWALHCLRFRQLWGAAATPALSAEETHAPVGNVPRPSNAATRNLVVTWMDATFWWCARSFVVRATMDGHKPAFVLHRAASF